MSTRGVGGEFGGEKCRIRNTHLLFTLHTCPPQNWVFRNKNHQNPEHSIISETHQQIYQIFTGKSQVSLHCAPPLPILRTWEHCLPITRDYMPVQSFHNSSANFRVQTSGTFLTNDDERPLLMVYFLKRFETSLFRWRRFWRCMINRSRFRHAFPQTQTFFNKWHPDSKDLFSVQLRMRCSL